LFTALTFFSFSLSLDYLFFTLWLWLVNGFLRILRDYWRFRRFKARTTLFHSITDIDRGEFAAFADSNGSWPSQRLHDKGSI
jgi:hypothetical protein